MGMSPCPFLETAWGAGCCAQGSSGRTAVRSKAETVATELLHRTEVGDPEEKGVPGSVVLA